MPVITNPGVVKALATAYLSLDRNKAAAAMKIGYSKNYAQNGNGALLFDRADVKAEIDRQEVELVKKTGYSPEQCQYEYDQARRHAITLKQPSAEVSAVTGKARLHGFDKDASADKDIQQLTTAQAEAVEEFAAYQLRKQLKKA